MRLRTLTLALTAVVIAACAASKPIGEWRNQGYSGELNEFLVIAFSTRSTRRRVFEDKFVEVLAIFDTAALPSYQLVTSTPILPRDTIAKAVRARNLDAVLITRLVGVQKDAAYVPPPEQDHYRHFRDYYDFVVKETQGYPPRYRELALETTVYDAVSGDLVWSMQSVPMEASLPRHVIEEQILSTIDGLRKQGLLGE